MRYYVDQRGAYIVTLPSEETVHVSYLGQECISAYWQKGKGADWMYLPVSLVFLQSISEVTYEQFIHDTDATPLHQQFEKMLSLEEHFSLPEMRQICASYHADKDAYEARLHGSCGGNES